MKKLNKVQPGLPKFTKPAFLHPKIPNSQNQCSSRGPSNCSEPSEFSNNPNYIYLSFCVNINSILVNP